jgi:hypothetical protein
VCDDLRPHVHHHDSSRVGIHVVPGEPRHLFIDASPGRHVPDGPGPG